MSLNCYGSSLKHCPEQTHNPVHGRLALKHLQFPLHRFVHLHLISSQHSFEASGSTVQNGCHPLSFFFQPHSAGDGISGFAVCDCPQI